MFASSIANNIQVATCIVTSEVAVIKIITTCIIMLGLRVTSGNWSCRKF